MASRVPHRPRPDALKASDDDKVISLDDARFRFRWIERDISEMKETIIGHGDDLRKINRNVLIVGCVLVGLGIGSRLFSTDVIAILAKAFGFG
jgi:hypothetical protein